MRFVGASVSQIGRLLEQLNKQIQEDDKLDQQEFIEELQLFVDDRDNEEIAGLENKLKHADREKEIEDATLKKEAFQKLLKRMEYYSSAQKVFAIFLSRIHEVFDSYVMNLAEALSREEVENIVHEKIIQPIMNDMDKCNNNEHLLLTPTHVKGMIFWLADRCWVRWH